MIGRLKALGGEVARLGALMTQDDVVLLPAGGRSLDDVLELVRQLVQGGGSLVRLGLGAAHALG